MLIREIEFYNTGHGSVILRYDVLTKGGTQFTVEFDKIAMDTKEIRLIAKAALRRDLINRGMKLNSLIKLPLPSPRHTGTIKGKNLRI